MGRHRRVEPDAIGRHREAGGQALNGYVPSTKNNLTEGDIIAPDNGYAGICIADSHKLAIACWRYREPTPTYYRVQTYSYSGAPTAADEIPGLYLCSAAKVLGKVHNGEGLDGGEKWTDEELWPYIGMARWPDGSRMYDEQGYLTNLPDMSPCFEGAQPLMEGLFQQRYRLPFFIKKNLENVSTFRFGHEWPLGD